MNKRLLETIVVGLLVSILSCAQAHAANGIAKMTMNDRLNVARCGSDRTASSFKLVLQNRGVWFAQSQVGKLGGTFTTRSRGRVLIAEMDDASQAKFVRSMQRRASRLCRAKTTTISKTSNKVKFKLNKKRTALRGRIIGKGEGSNEFGRGTASYLAKLKGPFS